MHIIMVAAVALLVGLDQLTKTLAVQHLQPIGKLSLIDGVFSLSYLENRGMAFGMLQDADWARWFFVAITLVILAVVLFVYKKTPKSKVGTWMRVSLVLITAGAIGNFIDRLFNGYVVDFIYFELINFPMFNVADICVVCGTFLLAVLVIFFDNDKSVKEEA